MYKTIQEKLAAPKGLINAKKLSLITLLSCSINLDYSFMMTLVIMSVPK